VKFLADEGLDWPIVERMRAEGYDVTYVAEMAPGLSDDDVLRLALADRRVLLTTDKDFGEIVRRRRGVGAGIVLVRCAGLSASNKAAVIVAVLASRGSELSGAFTVITPSAVRIRGFG
jgi:predicted nuclease of predicted toxin-antitoxin system